MIVYLNVLRKTYTLGGFDLIRTQNDTSPRYLTEQTSWNRIKNKLDEHIICAS